MSAIWILRLLCFSKLCLASRRKFYGARFVAGGTAFATYFFVGTAGLVVFRLLEMVAVGVFSWLVLVTSEKFTCLN